jgi:hypothetical protein
MRAEWSLFDFDNSGSGRQKSPCVDRPVIFETWTIQLMLLVPFVCCCTCVCFVTSFHQAYTIISPRGRFCFAHLRRTSDIAIVNLFLNVIGEAPVSSNSYDIAGSTFFLEILVTKSVSFDLHLFQGEGRISSPLLRSHFDSPGSVCM